jgi:hypothetical protein
VLLRPGAFCESGLLGAHGPATRQGCIVVGVSEERENFVFFFNPPPKYFGASDTCHRPPVSRYYI